VGPAAPLAYLSSVQHVEASVGKPQVAYKETLTRPAEGEGTALGVSPS
jgi:translation elongation factor EF-G